MSNKNKSISMQILDKDLRIAMRGFKKNGDALHLALMKEVNKATMNTGAEAQLNLKENDSMATRNLLNSISNRFNKSTGTGTITVNAPYGEDVEFGRKSGVRPKVSDILAWIKKKGILNTTHAGKGGKRIKDKRDDNQKAEELGMAIAITNNIEDHGTEAKPFLIPAWKVNAKKLVGNLKKVLWDSKKYMKY